MSKGASPTRARALAAVARLAAEFAARRPIRCPSLIVTLFGDVVEPHGGVLWLGSMVESLGLLGIDERLVRTSTFRLVQDGWLEATRDGRRSYYRFSAYGRGEYVRAARRIYARDPPAWDGNWTLLLPVAVPEARREAFRRSALWAGYGNLAPNVHAHPGGDLVAAGELLAALGLSDKVVVMQAGTDELQSNRLLRELLWQNWELGELAAAYARFVQRFRPVASALARARTVSAEQCFVARLLLVHEYRRVLLHDTDIPGQLLPRDWPGPEARGLAAEIYHAVASGSVDFIRARLEGAGGPLPAAAESFARRFGA
jgi:phenylacetic acid degradation operon negative regulatory protein